MNTLLSTETNTNPFGGEFTLNQTNKSILKPVTASVTENNQINKDFLGELRDFMNEFAESDLNLDSIEEPNKMSSSQANFYIKLYHQLISEEEEMNQLCDDEIDRTTKAINLFREKRQNEINRKKSYFESILKEYASEQLSGKKSKTLKLPYGNLSFKKQQPKFSYGDDNELKAMVKQIDPELIKSEVIEKLDKSNLKKHGEIRDDGFYLNNHRLDLVTVQKQDDKFEIK